MHVSLKKKITRKNEEIMTPTIMHVRLQNIWRVASVPENCTGCMTCSAICSLSREGKISPALARIHVKTMEEEWLRGLSDRILKLQVCEQCPGVPPCMSVCPVDALYRDEKKGTVLINYDVCIECKECKEYKKCVDACPYGGIWYNEKIERVIKCDTCNGEPKCVEWCPTGALVYEKVC